MRSSRSCLLLLVVVSAAFVGTGCGDDESPRILSVVFPEDTTDPIGPYLVEAVVSDNRAVHEVNLLLAADLAQAFDRLKMEDSGEGHYQTSFGELAPGQTVYLIVEARDREGNRSRYPDAESQGSDCVLSGELCWHRFRVLDTD
jgi:hypothetical protein